MAYAVVVDGVTGVRSRIHGEGREDWKVGPELADASKFYFLAHEADFARAAANG